MSTSFAQTFTAGGIDYNVTSAVAPLTVEVASNPNVFNDVTIPSTVNDGTNDYTVTSISSSAFVNNTYITSVTIPNTVTNIGSIAFAGCSNLASVTIPNSVNSLSSYVFSGCSSLTNVVLPNSISTLPNGTFYGCSGLSSVTLPNTITNIPNNTFYNCSNLSSINIPNTVTNVGDYAFYSCVSLTSLPLPDSVENLGFFAFSTCTGLTNISLPNSLKYIGQSAFEYCNALTTVTIPASVLTIGDFAFYSCTSLNTVNCYVSSPLAISADVFGNITLSACTLNVPVGTNTAYSSASVWQDFGTINGTLGSSSFTISENIKVYPNPVSNSITIETKDLTNVSLKVYDMNGREMMDRKLSEITNTVDTSNLQTGVYVFAIASQEGSTAQKVVKK